MDLIYEVKVNEIHSSEKTYLNETQQKQDNSLCNGISIIRFLPRNNDKDAGDGV